MWVAGDQSLHRLVDSGAEEITDDVDGAL